MSNDTFESEENGSDTATEQRIPGGRKFPRFGLSTLLLIVTLASAFFAWRLWEYERGTINRWIDATLAEIRSNPLEDNFRLAKPAIIPCPIDVSAKEQLRLLKKSLNWLPTTERRITALKIMVEHHPELAHDVLIDQAADFPNRCLSLESRIRQMFDGNLDSSHK